MRTLLKCVSSYVLHSKQAASVSLQNMLQNLPQKLIFLTEPTWGKLKKEKKKKTEKNNSRWSFANTLKILEVLTGMNRLLLWVHIQSYVEVRHTTACPSASLKSGQQRQISKQIRIEILMAIGGWSTPTKLWKTWKLHLTWVLPHMHSYTNTPPPPAEVEADRKGNGPL